MEAGGRLLFVVVVVEAAEARSQRHVACDAEQRHKVGSATDSQPPSHQNATKAATYLNRN